MSPTIGRIAFLRLAGRASAAWVIWPRLGFARESGQAPDEREARISRIIDAYDRQGIHRTATETDNRSAAWLAEQARMAGGDVTLESFALARVDVRDAFVELGDRKIEGIPLFDGTFTSAQGITGRLGASGTDADIALVSLDAAGIFSEGRPLVELRRGSRYKALVIVTRGTAPGLTPMNAPAFTAPFGSPALQVASDVGAWLDDQARQRAEIRFVAHADRTTAQASNVVVRVPGRDPALAPVVVMTPRSGWWKCASERGGGIACWLEAMRAAKQATARRTVLFVASSGHELGHLGLDAFLASRRELVKGAAAWVHLGANIGAAGGSVRVQSSDDQIEQMGLDAVLRAGAAMPGRVARGTVPAGEARNIHAGGGRYVSLLGTSAFFHSPADRWPAAVDAPAVARYAAAIADLTRFLSS